MFSQCTVVCCSCGNLMDYMKRYGRESCCCSKDCWGKFEWRHTLAIMGKAYYPKPTDHEKTERASTTSKEELT